ncbi:MAG: type II toxin-antitoxin system ParD family antitoxin [Verrucomicrobia bacterium]|nr:type II toxin-antitoxin system ParD family antitoxin [Verrucomicrobiota bacterium]
MNVSLTNEMEHWVQRKVETGLYSSASEVVREALRALHAKETRHSAKIMHLREAIQVGLVSMKDSGDDEWSVELSEEVKRLGRKRRRS